MNIDKAKTHLRKVDPTMAKLISKYGSPNFEPIKNHFESLARSIIYQQLSGKAANAIYERFKNLFGNNDSPYPENILILPAEVLQKVGLSKQKIIYLKDLSIKWEQIKIQFSNIEK